MSIYEMLRGQRPFHVDRNMSNDDIFNQMKHTRPTASARWDQHTCDMLKMVSSCSNLTQQKNCIASLVQESVTVSLGVSV